MHRAEERQSLRSCFISAFGLPCPRSPKSQGAWARTAPASRLAVQSVAAIRLRKKDVVPIHGFVVVALWVFCEVLFR